MSPSQEPMKEKQAESVDTIKQKCGWDLTAQHNYEPSNPKNKDFFEADANKVLKLLESERKRADRLAHAHLEAELNWKKRADEAENELISIRETLKLKIEQKALRGCFISSREFTHYQVLQEKKLAEAEEKIKGLEEWKSGKKGIEDYYTVKEKVSELREIIRKQREALEILIERINDGRNNDITIDLAKTALEIKEKGL